MLFRPIEGLKSTALYPTVKTVGFTAIFYNEKGYSPENCRWVSRTQNQNNRRDNVKVTFRGVTLTLSEWSIKGNAPYKTLWARLNKYRWSFEKAITTPIRQHKIYKLNTKEK